MSSSAERADRTDRAERADRTGSHDSAALDEIELAGELMIAASASSAERLPTARIDEVLLQQPTEQPGPAAPAEDAGQDG
ncbi:hypothetical protein [Kitasatospora sp. LaBMicrA B282]|uniref:hypothetical protein n=1 Tax=Kitasatospora sp. LaBMicrA B282 TaxID=3420949 RepID=UPI003D138F8E